MATTAAAPGNKLSQEQVPRRLGGKLGVGSIVFMVVAAAAPLTVIAGTVPLGISAGNGAAFPASYIVCTVILLLFAVGFTAMARHVPGAGAFYTYITHGLGRHAGLGSAFLALLSYTAVQGAVYGYIGAAINDFVSSHGGPTIPWYLWAAIMMAVVAFLGYRQIDLSGKVLGVLLICEVGIVLVIDVAVVLKGGTGSGLSTASLHPSQFFAGAPGIALIFAIAGYIGFEATAVFRDEAKDPARTIPRATYVALLVIGGFYAVSSLVVGTRSMGGHPPAGFDLLSVQIAAVWLFAACWSRRPGESPVARTGRARAGAASAALVVPLVGTTLMAVAMSAMMAA